MRRRRCVRFGFAACSTWVGVSCTSEGSKTLLRVHWHAVHAPPSGPNASAHPPCQPGIVVCHCWASSTPSVAHMAVVWFLASHAHASPDPAATSGCVQAADTMNCNGWKSCAFVQVLPTTWPGVVACTAMQGNAKACAVVGCGNPTLRCRQERCFVLGQPVRQQAAVRVCAHSTAGMGQRGAAAAMTTDHAQLSAPPRRRRRASCRRNRPRRK